MAQGAVEGLTAEPQIAVPVPSPVPATPSPETAPAPVAEPSSPSIPLEVASGPDAGVASTPEAAPVAETPAETAPTITAEAPKAEGEAQPTEDKPQGPRTYEPFTIPEGFAVEPANISAYGNILSKYDMPQEAGQELLEFGSEQVKQAIRTEAQRQQDVFSDTQRKWSKQIDKEYGNRRDTAIRDANWVLSEFGGTKTQIRELNEALAYTGAGNHPALVRALVNISKRLREREAPPASLPKNGASNVPAWDKRYGARA